MSKTRMIEAVTKLDIDVVRELLATEPDLLRVTDCRGFSLLHLARWVPCADLGIADSQSAKIVNLLLDGGLDVESKLPPGQDRCTAFFFAVARGRNATLIKLLLKRGAKAQNAPGGGLFRCRVARRRQLCGSEAGTDGTTLRHREGIPSGAAWMAGRPRRLAGHQGQERPSLRAIAHR